VLILFTAVCFYSFTYMQHEERPRMFFAFFFIALGAMMAVCMSADMVSLYFAFELATLSTVPMVLHEMTKESITAGLKYLFYSMGGALMGLLAVFYIYSCAAGEVSFRLGGFLDPAKIAGHEQLTLAVILVGIIGFGTKAGMYPMHGWLPTAHPIAPAPASALLSGIITKAGVVAIIRLVYYCVGADLLRGTWVQTAWMSLSLLTILMGSTMAFREKVIKKRLAYSSVSQISYVLFSLSLLTEDGIRGCLLQLISHMSSKGCLFLAAGVFIFVFEAHHVDELKGIGKALPVTMWCFMIASLSLVGIPPMGGFVSKCKIASAALSGAPGFFAVLGPAILLVSALLTAGYLFPIVVDAFFPGNDFEYEEGDDEFAEPGILVNASMIALCVVALLAGLIGAGIVGGIVL
jgi:multicomponent Na+:H+ antiporter subunit D